MQNAQRAGAADGVAAEGRAVAAGGEHILHLLAEQRRAQRQAAAEALGRGDDVRRDAVVHVAVELAAAAVADLHLVADEQQVLLGGELGSTFDKFLRQRDDAALALHDLHHDGGALVRGDLRLEIVEVIRLGVGKTLRQRQKVVVEHVLPGRGERCDRAAVEAVFERDDGVVLRAFVVGGVLARGLDGALVGLCAGVGEEDLLHAGLLAQQLRQLRVGRGVVEVRGVLHGAQLLGHGADPRGVGDAEAVDGDARRHVDIDLVVRVPDERALAARDRHGEAGVSVGDIGTVKLRNVHLFFLLARQRTWCRCLRLSAFRSGWRAARGRR